MAEISPGRRVEWQRLMSGALERVRLLFGRKAPKIAAAAPAGLDPAVASFADTLADPCFLVDGREVVVYRNRAASASFPRARVGDPLAFTLRNPELLETMEKTLGDGVARAVEIHLALPNETWYRVAIAGYRPREDHDFLVLTLQDLTAQKRTDRMRADFVANASHELRTPLTSLVGAIETLQGPAARDEAARVRFLAIMSQQAGRMSALIDDLLSLSRIEARQHIRPTEPVDLKRLLGVVAAGLEARIAGSGVALDLRLPETPAMAIGDEAELIVAVETLLDNALKYGGSGGRIAVTLEEGAGRGGGHHAVTVTDFGPGIPAEHVPRLTERFYRAGGGAKGTGLGLAIVKHIVSRHHGTLAIRSTPGEGTSVEIGLPRG